MRRVRDASARISQRGRPQSWRLWPRSAITVRAALALIGASVTSGCAVVEKVAPSGAVERSIALLSPVSIVGGSADAPRAVRVAGIGLGMGHDSAVLGGYEISAVHLDQDCRVVIMPKNNVELDNFRQLLEKTPNICVIKN
jgi:hypothetical protein